MDVTQRQEWMDLEEHFKSMSNVHLNQLFDEDHNRAKRYSLESCGLYLDYSKNLVTDETMDLFEKMLQAINFREKREQMFNGFPINVTEKRAVLHTALRNQNLDPIIVNGHDVMSDVRNELDKMRDFCHRIQRGDWKGYTGKKIRHVVNIGIGGSDLGPQMVSEALRPYHVPEFPEAHFVSNVDGAALFDVLLKVDIEETLFLVASKTFTTMETMTNAEAAKEVLVTHYEGDLSSVAHHFAALSTNTELVTEFGIDPKNMFVFWDWVGGRYSSWSAIGFSIALYLGFEYFEELLKGAYKMDVHFRDAPLQENMPVIMACLGVWYNNFFNWESHAVLPYLHNMHRFPAYLQQLDMESNGKRVTVSGRPVKCYTGPIIWGDTGTNAQHAFFQLIHQGTRRMACDFIGAVNAHHRSRDHQYKLLANCLAQSEALMEGKTLEVAKHELTMEGLSLKEVKRLAPHKVFEGNRPSNTILMRKLTPRTLGALIALYEHKVFTQGLIWGINSFDQFGVELGKVMAKNVLRELKLGVEGRRGFDHDTSTNALLRYCMNNFE